MTLSEMRQILRERGIQLTKSLGQNFLFDRHQLERIGAAAELTKHDKVLEIGPGLGPLTELLLEQAAEVLAVEKDARLVRILEDRLPRPEGLACLHLLHDDALDFLRREPRDWREWKLVANLPYSVASPILVELAQAERSPQRLVATLQLEVARRLMAGPGETDYGVLTLLVQLDFEPRSWFKIPASCFFPQPDVDSGCVCLVRRSQPLLAPERRRAFVRIVKRAFSQRRKMMLKLLKQDWPAQRLETALTALRLPATVRGEKLSLEQFVRLTDLLCDTAP